MRKSKRLSGLFAGRINRRILRQTLREHRVLCAVFLLSLVVFASCVAVYPRLQAEPPKYEIETSGGEIDFVNPEIRTHTAADGIAVVGKVKNTTAIGDENATPVSLVAEPAKLTDDPAAIWTAEATPTHSGFTMPVPMDDSSIGVLTISDISLSVRVYESENEMEAMQKGAAHFKSTSAWEGNIGLSAHNINLDGSAGYFLNLYKLKKGAVIRYETALGTREYLVESVTEIAETDWSTLGRSQENRITLITCISGKPTQRLCVQAAEKTA